MRLERSSDYDRFATEAAEIDGYKTRTVPKQLVVFRGGQEAPSASVPAFFGDRTTIDKYLRNKPENLWTFRFVERPRLFELSYPNLIKLFDEDARLTDLERSALDAYLVVSETSMPYVWPVTFLSAADKAANLYLNRRILNIVCRLGFDGWIVMPDSLVQKNIDLAHFRETEEIRYALTVYEPEIALCEWTSFLELVKK